MQANADMAELADASALGADVFDVGVQIPLSAPNKPDSTFCVVGLVFVQRL